MTMNMIMAAYEYEYEYEYDYVTKEVARMCTIPTRSYLYF